MRLPARYRLDAAIAGSASQPGREPNDGPLGRVVAARDGDRLLALEVLRPDLAEDPRARDRLARAVFEGAALVHPHLVATYDCDRTEDDIPFVASPWPAAPSVAAVASDAGWTEIAAWTDQILAALAHVHARGIVYGALAPDRVWVFTVGRERQVRLVDPFRAQIPAELGLRSAHPRYLAPEQIQDEAYKIGRWTDLFAVGVMLWELVTGSAPFQGRATALDAELPAFTPRIPVPARLETILANLLRPDPLARYDLAADVRTELAAPRLHIAPSRGLREGTAAPGLPWRPAGAQTSDLSAPPPGSDWNRPVPAPLPPKRPPVAGMASPPAANLELFVRRELPLIGRDEHQDALWAAALRVVADRRPAVVVVSGPRGSGRTRFARAFARTVEELGAAEPVWIGYSSPASGGTGHAALSELGFAAAEPPMSASGGGSIHGWILRHLAREQTDRVVLASGGSADAHRVQLEAEAACLAGWCRSTPASGPGVGVSVAPPLGLFEVMRTVAARAWRGFGVLILDDVHLAEDDHEGLAIAELVARRVDDVATPPILVVATVDTDVFEDRPSLEERVSQLVSDGGLRIRLDPLSDDFVSDIVSATLPLDDATVRRLVGVHGRRPDVIREILLGWAQRGWLMTGPDGVMLSDAALDARGGSGRADEEGDADDDEDDDPVPARAETALRQRIASAAALTKLERRLLDLVHLTALSGAGGRVGLPAQVFESFAGPELADRALRTGLWERTAGWLTLVREVREQAVADATAREDRAYLHRRLGRTFGRVVTAAAGAYEAGDHALLGNDAAFGVPWLLRAAHRAAHAGRIGELHRASKRALDAVEADPELASLKPSALLWRARAHEARSELVDAADRFERARAAFDAVGDAAPAIEALTGLGYARLRAYDPLAADAKFSDALTRARDAGLPHLEARAIVAKARVEVVQRRLEDADLLFARARARATELGDRRGVGEGLIGIGLVARRSGRFDEADAAYIAAAEAFRDAADLVGQVAATLGHARSRLQRTVDDDTVARFVWCAERGGMLGAHALPRGTTAALELEARLGVADCARLRADADQALAIYTRCSDWADRSDAIDGGVAASLGLALVALDVGDLTLAYEHTRRAADWLGRGPGHPSWAKYRLIVATLLARRREHTQTWQWLWSAQEFGAADAVDRDIAACLASICENAAEAGWANVLRLAGKLGVQQFTLLGDPGAAGRLDQRVSAALKGA